jgi:DNA mismatch repair protein MutL
MPKIKVLSENLANKIAAGEVVERPASVVKELMENAIDAKSRRIFVTIREGGSRLIQVQDDGEGMDQNDALLAFQRHATSKVAGEADLSSIMTLGFRGEALPSIASVSKVRLVTQSAGEEVGTEIAIEGGVVQGIQSVGSPRGSLFEVSDLFFNTPARRKFLKSRQTELGHINDVVFQLALSHPEIHFRLCHGEKVLIDSPSVPHLRDRVLQLFGEAALEACMEISEERTFPSQAGARPGIEEAGSFFDEGSGVPLVIHAFFSRPPLRRNHRKDQYLFVNRRSVKNHLLSHALYEAYGSYLMKGEHPFFILFLSLDPERIDVNVHPTKREIRFQNADWIYQAVRGLIRTTLSSAGWPSLKAPLKERLGVLDSGGEKFQSQPGIETVEEERGIYLAAAQSTSASGPWRESPSIILSDRFPLIRPLGQIYGTFLLAEIGGELTIIDQHTAHERILYESLLEKLEDRRLPADENVHSHSRIEIQPLLIPQQIDLPMAEAALLRDHLKKLEEVGWSIDLFGETTFLIREVPALISGTNLESLLLDMTGELAEMEVSSKADQPMLKIIASMACHGAVRAHQSLTLPEIEVLLKGYFQRNTPPTCPHGRPILLKYPLSELEKLFRRK